MYWINSIVSMRYVVKNKLKIVRAGNRGVLCWQGALVEGVSSYVFCIRGRKPYVLIDAEKLSVEQASRKVVRFVENHSVSVLNVAGLRASDEPRAYEYAKKVILSVLQT